MHLSRLWLNARHLARFSAHLAESLERQEELDRDRLVALIEEGNAAGEFRASDPLDAAVRIFIAIDGFGSYANNPVAFDNPAYTRYIAEIVEWVLRIDSGDLEAAAKSASVLP